MVTSDGLLDPLLTHDMEERLAEAIKFWLIFIFN